MKPDVIMQSMSGAGQFGPIAQMRTYAPVMSSFVSLEELIGYPGEEAIGALNFALGDPNAAAHGLMALFAALLRRQPTGEGSYLDLSQTEALLCTLTPFLLESQLTGAQPPKRGNRHPRRAPHGILPTRGEDAWITLAIDSDDVTGPPSEPLLPVPTGRRTLPSRAAKAGRPRPTGWNRRFPPGPPRSTATSFANGCDGRAFGRRPSIASPVELSLWVRNQLGERTASGEATVELPTKPGA